MDIAVRTAAMSLAEKKKVGCVIVRDNRLIAAGWNGTPSGTDNTCEYFDDEGHIKTRDDVIHAEMNALIYCSKKGIPVENCTAYITLSPCLKCAASLIQSGIKRVVYKEEHTHLDGLYYLKEIPDMVVEKIDD